MTMDAAAVHALIFEVRKGEVASYGMIASLIPGCGPRMVARALWTAPKNLPWFRVVTASGAPADHDGAEKQRALLRNEGVSFRKNGAVDWSKHRWTGPSQRWVDRSGLDIQDAMAIIAGWRR